MPFKSITLKFAYEVGTPAGWEYGLDIIRKQVFVTGQRIIRFVLNKGCQYFNIIGISQCSLDRFDTLFTWMLKKHIV
ncbi:MAG TPA: hypothetical protein DCL60_04770 [Armatimonadetes bacterium]|nr:hypothetical protein [Armatimonadota bacterium]